MTKATVTDSTPRLLADHGAVRRQRFSYDVLRVWARAAVRVVYGRVELSGREHVSPDRPIVFAVNHSNALADVAIVVATAPRFPHFLAAASWWKRRSARALFALGGVLPLQRRRDEPGLSDNGRTFEACFDALADGAHLVIFPEGVMHPEPTLQPLRTGAARIGLGAAQLGVGNVAIVPMGLVYEDRGRWRSAAAVRFGPPIAMDDWLERYEADPFATVRAVTDQLAAELACVCRPMDDGGDTDATTRTQLGRELALLTPAAAVGAVANAPLVLAGALANVACDEMWQASAKGVAGTFLLPIVWATEVAYLSRRYGLRGAAALTAAGALGGWATIAWIDRKRALS